MNPEYYKDKLLDLKKTSEEKIKYIADILKKTEDYENNLEKELKISLLELETIINTQKEINNLFDIICVELNTLK
jgi:hypothetical protein